METLLGGLLGGLFRLAPELISFLDRKNERNHEKEMLEKQIQFDSQRSADELKRIETQGGITLDVAGLDALKAAIKAQASDAKAAGGWAAKLSASVRPVLTYYWCIVLYTLAMVCQFYVLVHGSGIAPVDAVLKLWGVEEKTIVAGMINFWFLDRAIRANQGK